MNKKFLDKQISLLWQSNDFTITVPYFRADDCEKIFKFCEENSIGILGMDGFTSDGKHLIDVMDIYDPSSCFNNMPRVDFIRESINGARMFLNNRKEKDEYFEIVFAEKE